VRVIEAFATRQRCRRTCSRELNFLLAAASKKRREIEAATYSIAM